MKQISTILLAITLCLGIITSKAQTYCPPNIDFENGNFTNWEGNVGSAIAGANTSSPPILTFPINSVGFTASQHTIVTGGVDIYSGMPMVCNLIPNNFASVKLGDDNVGAVAASITYKIKIPATNNSFELIYYYALVFEDGLHTMNAQPTFNISIIDSATNSFVNPCSNYNVICSSSFPLLNGFYLGQLAPTGPSVCCPWTASKINLSGQANKTIYITFKISDCAYSGHFGYGYLDFPNNCNGLQLVQNSNCTLSSINTLSAPLGFENYTWYDSSFSTILSHNATDTLLNLYDTSLKHCIVEPLNGWGCKDTLTTKFNPNPKINADFILANNYCINSEMQFFDNSVTTLPGDFINKWSWNFGDPSSNILNSDSTQFPVHTYTNFGTYTVSLIANSSLNCQSDTILKSVIINKIASPIIVSSTKDTICGNSDSITFSISNIDTTFKYQWLVDSSAILMSGDLQKGNSITLSFNKIGNHSIKLISYPPIYDTNCVQNGFKTINVKAIARKILTIGLDSICSNSSTNISLYNPSNNLIDCGSSINFATIGNSSGYLNNSISNTIFKGLYTESRSQILYTKSELNSVGFYGGKVDELSWNIITKRSSMPYNGFTIKLANVPYNSLSIGKFDTTSSKTIVFNSSAYNSVIGYNNFVLQSPFYWDGFSNILVEICFDNGTNNFTSNDDVQISNLLTVGYYNSAFSDNNLYTACNNQYPFNLGISSSLYRPDINIKGRNCNSHLTSSSNLNWSSNPTGLTSINDTIQVSINANTFYTAILTENGCISTANHPLKISTQFNLNINQPICNGKPFSYHGKSYSQMGTFHDTIFGTNSCDTFITINLYQTNYVKYITKYICSKDSFNFYGTFYKNQGTYYHTISSPNSCDTIVVLNLLFQFNTKNLNILQCIGTSYNLNGNLITSSGNYYDTITSINNGCDTMVYLNIVFSNTYQYININQCLGTTYNFNGNLLSSSGTYYDTIFGQNNTCDTIQILNLTISNYVQKFINDSACLTTGYYFNGHLLNNSGFYFDTIPSGLGCGDTIVRLNLQIIQSNIITITHSVCNGQAYIFHGKSYTQSGTYWDTIASTYGCDTLYLLVLSFYNNQKLIQATICGNNSYFFNNQNLTTSGIYYDTIATSISCDTIVQLNLVVVSTSTQNINSNICENTTYAFGSSILSASGLYIDSLKNIYGCDSIINLTLLVDSIDNTISQNFNSLQSNETSVFAAFQWIDCNNQNQPIVGAFYKIFTPLSSGIYAVIIQKNNCSDTSNCIFYNPNCFAHYSADYDTLTNTFIVTVDSITATQAVSYLWNFGDGTTSNSATPTHQYLIDTTYNVCLQIITANGDTCSYCHIIGKDYLGHIIKNAGFTINIKNPYALGINLISNSINSDVNIFPNPTTNLINLSWNKAYKVDFIEIKDVLGRKLITQYPTQNSSIISLQNLSAGIYYINVSGNQQHIYKVIKIN